MLTDGLVFADDELIPHIANDKSLPMEERFAARLKLAEMPRNSSAVRVRNRCLISGRPRGTLPGGARAAAPLVW